MVIPIICMFIKFTFDVCKIFAAKSSGLARLSKIVWGDNLKTIRRTKLKLSQRDSTARITQYTKLKRNLSGRVLWLGRFVMECAHYVTTTFIVERCLAYLHIG